MRRDLDSCLSYGRCGCAMAANARSGFASMLEMMMVTRCQFTGGGGAPNDSLETSIEGAVTALTVVDETAALVVRIEYGAWEIRGLDINAPHIDKAHALSLSLRQYRRKLAKARAYVVDYLKKRRE
ncbi:Uncharacterised protein [Escherichia coli]|uniref:Uncharacterized protein n=1 Tax=Escherichia coli TaxID=562 RepID=A0A2X1LDQ6_ECOLX|nr:Uncharacterised protein [Escherichia coli]